MANITVEIIPSHWEKAAGSPEGEVVIVGVGVFKVGERVTGNPNDLQPLVAAGHARLVRPGEAASAEVPE